MTWHEKGVLVNRLSGWMFLHTRGALHLEEKGIWHTRLGSHKIRSHTTVITWHSRPLNLQNYTFYFFIKILSAPHSIMHRAWISWQSKTWTEDKLFQKVRFSLYSGLFTETGKNFVYSFRQNINFCLNRSSHIWKCMFWNLFRELISHLWRKVLLQLKIDLWRKALTLVKIGLGILLRLRILKSRVMFTVGMWGHMWR